MKQLFTANIWQENDWFVAHCNEIEIASQGKSPKEALEALQEAIELHFDNSISFELDQKLP